MKITTETELERFVLAAAPGEVCEYHNGDLAFDRAHIDDKGESRGSVKLHRVALLALKLAQSGLLRLVQRKHGENIYSYLAVRSGKRAIARAA